MIIEKNLHLNISISTKEVANLFCEMDDDEQAQFFNQVAVNVKGWNNPFCFQITRVADNEGLTPGGKAIMIEIGEAAM